MQNVTTVAGGRKRTQDGSIVVIDARREVAGAWVEVYEVEDGLEMFLGFARIGDVGNRDGAIRRAIAHHEIAVRNARKES